MQDAPATRIGIVGLGSMGMVHARSILGGAIPGMELVAVADADASRVEALAEVPTGGRFRDASEMIGAGILDALLIATPHPSHVSLGIAAIEAGLHVLIEKPLAVTTDECARFLSARASAPDRVCALMFNQRTDERFRKVKQLLEEGVLGEVRRMEWVITDWYRTAHYYRSGDWRATWAGEGGGVLVNQCPHNLDLWQWFFGMPERVIARCQFGRFHEIEVEDSVTALLEYPGGAQGVFVTTTGEAPGVNRLEVAGENGRIVIEGDGREVRFYRNEIGASEFARESALSFARPPVWDVRIPVGGTGEQHVGILKNFARAIRDGEALIAPVEDGIRSVELANAMLLSTFLDRPVTLPLDGALYTDELARRIANSTRVKPSVRPRGEKGGSDSIKAENFSASFGGGDPRV